MTHYYYIGQRQAIYVRNDGTRLVLDLRDVGILNFLTSDVYEPDVTGAITNILSPGGTFIDVGANLGIHSLHAWRRVAPSGTVIAIEANSELFFNLRRNIALNGAAGVVRPINAAAWSSDGELKFSFETEQHRVGAVVLDGSINYGVTNTSVKAVQIDTIITDSRNIQAIKIDVEGREPFVIEGAQKTIQTSRCTVIAEYHEEVIESTYGSKKFKDLVFDLKLTPHMIERDGSFIRLEDWPKTHANLALIPNERAIG